VLLRLLGHGRVLQRVDGGNTDRQLPLSGERGETLQVVLVRAGEHRPDAGCAVRDGYRTRSGVHDGDGGAQHPSAKAVEHGIDAVGRKGDHLLAQRRAVQDRLGTQ
jgi:hypothetical protein